MTALLESLTALLEYLNLFSNIVQCADTWAQAWVSMGSGRELKPPWSDEGGLYPLGMISHLNLYPSGSGAENREKSSNTLIEQSKHFIKTCS